MAAWCCRQPPGLYDQFCRNCEIRYVDEIQRLEQAPLRILTESRDLPALAPSSTACGCCTSSSACPP